MTLQLRWYLVHPITDVVVLARSAAGTMGLATQLRMPSARGYFVSPSPIVSGEVTATQCSRNAHAGNMSQQGRSSDLLQRVVCRLRQPNPVRLSYTSYPKLGGAGSPARPSAEQLACIHVGISQYCRALSLTLLLRELWFNATNSLKNIFLPKFRRFARCVKYRVRRILGRLNQSVCSSWRTRFTRNSHPWQRKVSSLPISRSIICHRHAVSVITRISF